MRRILTEHQRTLLSRKLRADYQRGAVRHVGLLGEQTPAWAQSDWVIATIDDVTRTGIKRACADCSEDAYTSIHYPDDVAIVCEVCTYDRLVGQEAVSP
jgi:hypothetical protein